MTPYEVYFYSSGGVEERWGPKDLRVNKVNAMIGYGLALVGILFAVTGAAIDTLFSEAYNLAQSRGGLIG